MTNFIDYIHIDITPLYGISRCCCVGNNYNFIREGTCGFVCESYVFIRARLWESLLATWQSSCYPWTWISSPLQTRSLVLYCWRYCRGPVSPTNGPDQSKMMWLSGKCSSVAAYRCVCSCDAAFVTSAWRNSVRCEKDIRIYPRKFIGRRGQLALSSRSPDLNPIKCFCG